MTDFFSGVTNTLFSGETPEASDTTVSTRLSSIEDLLARLTAPKPSLVTLLDTCSDRDVGSRSSGSTKSLLDPPDHSDRTGSTCDRDPDPDPNRDTAWTSESCTWHAPPEPPTPYDRMFHRIERIIEGEYTGLHREVEQFTAGILRQSTDMLRTADERYQTLQKQFSDDYMRLLSDRSKFVTQVATLEGADEKIDDASVAWYIIESGLYRRGVRMPDQDTIRELYEKFKDCH